MPTGLERLNSLLVAVRSLASQADEAKRVGERMQTVYLLDALIKACNATVAEAMLCWSCALLPTQVWTSLTTHVRAVRDQAQVRYDLDLLWVLRMSGTSVVKAASAKPSRAS